MSADEPCSLCNTGGRAVRPLPRPDESTPARFTLAPVCEPCVMQAIAELRAVVERAAADPDDDEAEMDMFLLVALLKRHGREITAEHTRGREGLEGIRHGLLTILDDLERRLMCSACGELIPESRATVMPWFNPQARAYVETFRCSACLPASIAESIRRVREVDGRAELDSLGECLRDHAIFVHEWLRGDPDEVVRLLFVHALQEIGRRSLVLRPESTNR